MLHETARKFKPYLVLFGEPMPHDGAKSGFEYIPELAHFAVEFCDRCPTILVSFLPHLDMEVSTIDIVRAIPGIVVQREFLNEQ